MKRWVALPIAFALTPMCSIAAEWKFYSEYTPQGDRSETVLLLSEVKSASRGCEGKLEASEQRLALGKWVYIRELCYEIDKEGMVKVTDPAKMPFFNTFTMKPSWFYPIKKQ